MRNVKVLLNGLILGLASCSTGLPMVLNGKGLEIRDYHKIDEAFNRFRNLKFVGKATDIFVSMLEKR